ncbi:hypothetical protein BC829DRAFT_391089 [Chytridium lagenaria]|nr:hypothetical protein BC829DRAFT_391089 [Chytridium lagenaria]
MMRLQRVVCQLKSGLCKSRLDLTYPRRNHLTPKHESPFPSLPKEASWSIHDILSRTEKRRESPYFSLADVERLAELAGLRVQQEEAGKLTQDINDLCAMVEPIQDIDTTGIKPLVSITHRYHPLVAMRDDIARESVTDQDADAGEKELFGRQLLRHARKSEGGFYVAPSLISSTADD